MTDSMRLHLREVTIRDLDLEKGFVVIRGETLHTSSTFQLDSQGRASLGGDFELRVSHSVIQFQIMKKGTLLQSDTLSCEGEIASDDYRSETNTLTKEVFLLDHHSSAFVGKLILDVQYVRKRDWLLDNLTKRLDDVAASILVDAPVRSDLNPVRFSNNFRRFVLAVTPVVALQEATVAVFQWKSPSFSAFTALVVFICMGDFSPLPLVIVILFLFYMTCGYVRKASDPPSRETDADLIKNLTFIQEFMGLGSDTVDYLQQWYQEVMCWNNPNKASACFEVTIRVALPIAVFVWLVNVRCLLPYIAAGSILITHPVVKALATSSVSTSIFLYTSLLSRILPSSSVPPLSPSRSKAKKDDSFDKRIFRVYENQRLWLGVWKYLLLPGERGVWSDVNGKDLSKEQIPLQEGMKWTDIWHIDGEGEGWEYAMDFSKPFHRKKEFFDYVRRRCWVRTAELIPPAYE